MNLREFLESREQELLKEIGEHHGRLAPLEAELAEICRAKGALGISAEGRASLPGISAEGRATLAGSGSVTVDVTVPVDWQKSNFADAAQIAAQRQRGNRAAIISSTGGTDVFASTSPYEHLTMKQLVEKVLREHFHNGATTRQMLEFFRDGWKRNIERANLSPQITRLVRDGVIKQRDDGRWFLVDDPDVQKLAQEDGVLPGDGEISSTDDD